MSVIYGSSSALSYGTADYLSQKAGRAVGAWRAAFYYYLLGFVALSIWIVLHAHELGRAQCWTPEAGQLCAPVDNVKAVEAFRFGLRHGETTPRYACTAEFS